VSATIASAGALYQAATTRDRLLEAWQVVRSRRGAPGIDRITVHAFEQDVYRRLLYLGTELLTRTYTPMPLRRVVIPKPSGGTRALGIPAVRFRIAQNALLLTLMPEAERRFLDCSYGYRFERNAHHAIAAVERLRDAEYRFVVNADIERCFDSLDHEIVFQRAADICRGDEDALELIRRWVAVPILSELGVKLPSIRGIPQGVPISPLLANLYLHPLDQHMIQRGLKWVRYADDFLCLTRTREEAVAALAIVRRYADRLRLRLRSDKSGVSSFAQGFEFLGFNFMASTKFIAPKRIEEVRVRIVKESSNRRAKGVHKSAWKCVRGVRCERLLKCSDALVLKSLSPIPKNGYELGRQACPRL
jgi:group II intron reverse transcriptase/maturase